MLSCTYSEIKGGRAGSPEKDNKMTNERLVPLMPPHVADALEQVRANTARALAVCETYWSTAVPLESATLFEVVTDLRKIGGILDAFIQTYPIEVKTERQVSVAPTQLH